ncbi:MAG: hypothetical protein HY896_03385 [Deltaproteobacteria bacterium]|nr:hypothetical protein [Deltaproteobacteria bacterium]
MKRSELEHIIRAASVIADDPEIIVIGSQAILGQFPDAPAPLLISMEADVIPRNRPERSELIEGSIGEGSPFHETFGYYGNGVDFNTAVLPKGWKNRLVRIQNNNTRGAVGWCLEVHDLVMSKYAAAREKDLQFNGEVIRAGYVDRNRLMKRLKEMPLPSSGKNRISGLVERAFAR